MKTTKKLYTIREVVRERLLVPAKANSYESIRKAIDSGELKAFANYTRLNGKGKTTYLIPQEAIDKFIKKRLKLFATSPVTPQQRQYIKNKSKKEKILYLDKRGYKQAVIAKEVGVSRQYVNEVIEKYKQIK